MPTLQSFQVATPPITEQQRIGSWLREAMAEWDPLETAANARLAAVKALPAALLRRAFGER
jgi:hypothetical protein